MGGIHHLLWSFSNQESSCYVLDRSRGKKVVKKILGNKYKGVLCSDYYGGYNEIKCEKQKCWVHFLREIRELKLKYPEGLEIKFYAKKMKVFFERAKRLKESFENGEDVDRRLHRLKWETLKWARIPRNQKDLNRLNRRLIKHWNETYTFIKFDKVDPTNNFAEREIHPSVLMRKTSYGNRSHRCGQNQAVLMSMIRTAQKQGQNFTSETAQKFIQ